MTTVLEVVPNSVVDSRGVPRFGTFRGELPAVDIGGLRDLFQPTRWQWGIRRKRWHFSMIATDEVLLCHAVVDAGFVGQSFIYAVDLYEERAVMSQRFVGAPGVQATVNDHPGGGHRSSFRAPGARLDLRRGEGLSKYRWRGRLHPLIHREPGGVRLDATIAAPRRPHALTVISPVESGLVNITQKWSALAAAGGLRVGSRSYQLEGGLAGTDYTQGILARRTRWRWAHGLGRLADGRAVGLNLVAGFNEGRDDINENALWVGEELIPLARAEFEYDPDQPEAPWGLRTQDGVVDLWFKPYYVFEDRHYWRVVNGHFVQPAGRFEGTIEIDGVRRGVSLVGVTEDQDIYW